MPGSFFRVECDAMHDLVAKLDTRAASRSPPPRAELGDTMPVYAAQSDGPATVIVIVGMAVLVGGIGVLYATVGRHKFQSRDTQFQAFAAQFDGRPAVYFAPWLWSLSQADARAIAWRAGYHEGRPIRRMLCFYRPPGPGGGVRA